MMKKFVSKIFIYGLFCGFVLNLIGFGAKYCLANSNFYKPSFLVHQFSKHKTFDYIILGSSRGLTTLNTKMIDEQLGTKGINLSMDDTDLKSHLLMLKHFINHQFTTKYCVLTLDNQHFNKTHQTLGNNDYKFMPFIHQKHIKKHYQQYETQTLKPLTNAYWLPILSLSFFNLELLIPAVIGAVKPNYKNRFDDKGNYSYPKSKYFKGQNNFKTLATNINNPLVKELQSLALKNNMQLIVYIAPYKSKKVVVKNKNLKVINHANRITKASLFYDHIHVNKKGRNVATQKFISDFKPFLK